MDKQNVAYPSNGILLGNKKECTCITDKTYKQATERKESRFPLEPLLLPLHPSRVECPIDSLI